MPQPQTPGLFGSIQADHDCRIIAINDTLAGWLGYSVAELEGQRFDSLLDPAGRLFFEAQCLPSLEVNGFFEEVYLSLQTKAGTPVPILINAERKPRQDKHTLDFAIVRMSRRARVDDELLRTKKLAIQADEAKSRFLGTISHELRNPLQSVSMCVNLLLEESNGPLTSVQRELLDVCHQAGTTLAELIDDLLDFARLDSGKLTVDLEPIPALQTLERATSLLKPRIEEADLTLHIEFPPPELLIVGDPRRIQQILLNLVTNAMKFTPSGGRITTRIVTSGDTANFEVEDTGCGISEEDLQQIFEAFVQAGDAQSNAKGLGLGLAISRDLAHAMGGELQVRSTPGVGSTFTLTLPLAPVPATQAADPTPTP